MQTDFIGYKPSFSINNYLPIFLDAKRFYTIQTDFLRNCSIETDYIGNITIISYFRYSLTKVPTPTTIILLGPRCFATRGQKLYKFFFFLEPRIYIVCRAVAVETF